MGHPRYLVLSFAVLSASLSVPAYADGEQACVSRPQLPSVLLGRFSSDFRFPEGEQELALPERVPGLVCVVDVEDEGPRAGDELVLMRVDVLANESGELIRGQFIYLAGLDRTPRVVSCIRIDGQPVSLADAQRGLAPEIEVSLLPDQAPAPCIVPGPLGPNASRATPAAGPDAGVPAPADAGVAPVAATARD